MIGGATRASISSRVRNFPVSLSLMYLPAYWCSSSNALAAALPGAMSSSNWTYSSRPACLPIIGGFLRSTCLMYSAVAS